MHRVADPSPTFDQTFAELKTRAVENAKADEPLCLSSLYLAPDPFAHSLVQGGPAHDVRHWQRSPEPIVWYDQTFTEAQERVAEDIACGRMAIYGCPKDSSVLVHRDPSDGAYF